MPRYIDNCRALLFNEIIEHSLEQIDSALNSLSNAIPISDNRSTLNKFSDYLAIYCDQSVLPAVAYLISELKNGVEVQNISEYTAYQSLFIKDSKLGILPKTFKNQFNFYNQQLETHINNLTLGFIKCLKRFAYDIPVIKEYFKQPLNKISFIEPVGSDSHNCGEQVYRFRFDNGFSIFYKPRSLKNENLITELMNEIGFDGSVIPRAYTKESYGWAEGLHFKALSNTQDIKNFWKRTGTTVAFCDALNFTDGHFENILATKTSIKIVDAETFFHNTKQIFSETEERSLLLTGFLQNLEDGDDEIPMMGGLQVYGSNRYHYVYPHPIHERSLNLEVKMRGKVHSAPMNQPIQNLKFQPPANHLSSFLDGLEKGYLQLQSNKNKIKSFLICNKDNFSFARQIVRATLYYAYIIRLLEQPELVRTVNDAQKVARKKLQLVHSDFKSLSTDPNLLIDYELNCLINKDIPVFYCHPFSRDLIDGTGKIYPQYFQSTAFEQITNFFECLDDAYITRQKQLASHHLRPLDENCDVSEEEISLILKNEGDPYGL